MGFGIGIGIGIGIGGQTAVEDDMPIVGEVRDFDRFTLPSGWLEEDGSAISRATYAALLAVQTLALTGTRSDGSAIITGIASTAQLRAGMYLEGTGLGAGAGHDFIESVDSSTQVTMNSTCTGAGATSLTAFANGNGDGSTTFNLADSRGRASLAVGLSAGLTDRRLGETGGVETHLLTAAESGLPEHLHTVTDPGHTHTVNDPGHSHTAADAGHSHAVTDPGHDHDYTTINGATDAATGGDTGAAQLGATTDPATTQITIDTGAAIITVDSGATSVTLGTSDSEVDVDNVTAADAAAAHINMMPFIARRRAVYAGV